jgi:hypothetical protein
MQRVFQAAVVVLVSAIFLAAGDFIQASMRGTGEIFRMLPGATRQIAGQLPERIDDIYLFTNRVNRLRAEPSNDFLRKYLVCDTGSPHLRLDLLDVNGRMWRGALTADAAAPAGEYRLDVHPRGGSPGRPITVALFADRAAYAASYPSLVERHLGFKPWWIIIGAMPLTFACLYVLSRYELRRDRRLIERGIGPVYKVARERTGHRIAFGLGRTHGITPGDVLSLLDEELRPVGEVSVAKAGPVRSWGLVDGSTPVSMNHYVAAKGAPY